MHKIGILLEKRECDMKTDEQQSVALFNKLYIRYNPFYATVSNIEENGRKSVYVRITQTTRESMTYAYKLYKRIREYLKEEFKDVNVELLYDRFTQVTYRDNDGCTVTNNLLDTPKDSFTMCGFHFAKYRYFINNKQLTYYLGYTEHGDKTDFKLYVEPKDRFEYEPKFSDFVYDIMEYSIIPFVDACDDIEVAMN